MRMSTGSLAEALEPALRHCRTPRPDLSRMDDCVAEGVGFEPTETRNASPVFKTGAIGH